MDKLFVSITGRVRAELVTRSGSNENGPWSMTLCEILDSDDNKVEVVLPRQGCPDLPIGAVAVFDCEVSSRRNRLSVSARRVRLLDVESGELRAVG